MKELIEYIAKSLVDSPEAVSVKEVDGDKVSIYELRVSTPDIGKIIGKEGRTIKALRTILACAAARSNKRVMLEVLE